PSKDDDETVTDRARVEDRGNLVTFLVNSRQAEALQLAAQYGTVSLAMRNPLDEQSAQSEPTLLHQGRLASWAEMMASSVPNQAEQPREQLAALGDTQSQLPPPANTSREQTVSSSAAGES